MNYLQSSIPLPLSEEQLREIIPKGKDWAMMHGASIRQKTNYSDDFLHFVPFILTPTTFPRREFEKAVKLQTILNELIHRVAHDTEFLTETLQHAIKADAFTKRLFEIYKQTLADGVTQIIISQDSVVPLGTESYYFWTEPSQWERAPEHLKNALSLGILRSDYLPHSINGNCIKQVEINTIASSFGGISTQLTPMHRYILQELGHGGDKLVNLPQNKALSGICNGLIKAWEIQANPTAVILIVIEDITFNICDQRFHEFYIRENRPDIRVIRKTLTEIQMQGSLGPDKELVINGDIVTVVYFRSGYDPCQYPTEIEWNGRIMMEQSRAIKCPSIHYQLAGTKKVQQALAKPGILSRFLSDESKIKAVSEIFTGLYSLDNTDDGQLAFEKALKNPEKYVMKPQREGGGSNVYGTDIPEILKNMTEKERAAWILMERIFPPISKGYLIKPNQEFPPPLVDLVSELGIFGVVIGDKDKIIYNEQTGHMLRTKLSTANEGGVAIGSGALDSPYLFDD